MLLHKRAWLKADSSYLSAVLFVIEIIDIEWIRSFKEAEVGDPDKVWGQQRVTVNEGESSFGGNQNILELDSGDCCTTLWIKWIVVKIHSNGMNFMVCE